MFSHKHTHTIINTVNSLAAIAAIAGNTYERPMERKAYVKPPLSKKEKAGRAKNKLAKQARKQNRKK